MSEQRISILVGYSNFEPPKALATTITENLDVPYLALSVGTIIFLQTSLVSGGLGQALLKDKAGLKTGLVTSSTVMD